MRELFDEAARRIDRAQLRANVESLWKAELPQTFTAHRAAAERALELLREAGIENAELINFPADGATVYQDKRMPLAWDASVGKLTVEKAAIPFDDPVVADYQRHPFHLIKGSVSTPPGGRRARIVTAAQLSAGADAAGALVLCAPEVWPRETALAEILDRGALGLITDYLLISPDHPKRREATPDAFAWVSACTEGSHWHVQRGDRPFIGFSVSPRVGDHLRLAAAAGELIAHVECDGKRHEGLLPAVTALIPGRQKRELWLMAHLFEPLSDDNSTGVAGAIEIARALKSMVADGTLPGLEFSLRLVFAMEMYGFAAFADRFGGRLGDRTVGAVNLDSMMSGNPDQEPHVFLSPPAAPFFGNYLMESLVESCGGACWPKAVTLHGNGGYGDDMCLSDPTVGLPTVWPIGRNKLLWHCSALTMDILDMDLVARTCAFIAAWAASVATLDKEGLPAALKRAGALARRHLQAERDGSWERLARRLEIERSHLMDFGDVAQIPELAQEVAELAAEAAGLIAAAPGEPPRSRGEGFERVAALVPTRRTIGLPYDQARVPRPLLRLLPDRMIYGPLSRVFANMDGRKDLRRLVREAEWEEGKAFDDATVETYVEAVLYLAGHGYLEMR